MEQRSTAIRNLLLFFDLEWLSFDDETAQSLTKNPSLATYRHYHLDSLRPFRPHTLADSEEKIVNEKDNTGKNAWGRFFSEITSTLTFSIKGSDHLQELNLSQILSVLHEPDRSLRQTALQTLYDGLSQHGRTFTLIYDTLIQDHLTMDRLRHYPGPKVQLICLTQSTVRPSIK